MPGPGESYVVRTWDGQSHFRVIGPCPILRIPANYLNQLDLGEGTLGI